MATLGVGSITLANLSKGKRPYWNFLRSVWSAVVKASVRNVPCVVPFVPTIQGESDAFVSLATRTAGLVQLQSDADADVKALTGQPKTSSSSTRRSRVGTSAARSGRALLMRP